jgi:hypothetical protein
VANARKRPLTVLDDKEKPMHTLGKDSWRSPRKIDGAMAAVLGLGGPVGRHRGRRNLHRGVARASVYSEARALCPRIGDEP